MLLAEHEPLQRQQGSQPMIVRLSKQLVSIAIITVLMTVYADSAEVRCVQTYASAGMPAKSSCRTGHLSGAISKGDYERVVGLYRANHPFLETFDLNSAGGRVDEAIKIGRLFRKYLVTTNTAMILTTEGGVGCESCTCASACALIWFGGVYRVGTVGLHRPRIEDAAFKDLPPDDASRVYRQALDDIANYLGEMEVPKPMIDAMVATSSADIRWVESGDDKLERPPSIAEWETASCGTFSEQEMTTMMDLFPRNYKWNPRTGRHELVIRTQQEKLLYKQLFEKWQRKGLCRSILIANHRERLAPP